MNAIAESPATSLAEIIVRTPGVVGGRPHVRGHRVAAHRVAGWWRLGLDVDEIAQELPTLSPAEIFAALAYYHLNKAEIDGYLEEERAACRQLERRQAIAA